MLNRIKEIISQKCFDIANRPLSMSHARGILMDEDPSETRHPRYAEALDCVPYSESERLREIYLQRN